MKLGELIQTGDWKGEKHVPVIDAPETVAAGEAFEVCLSVGKEIAHPNTTAHHISWMKLFFLPDGAKKPIELADLHYVAHAESPKGADEGPSLCEPKGSVTLKLKTSGTLMALSYCNIHGLWGSEKPLAVK